MRQLPNFIQGFLTFSEHLPTPYSYRLWSAITAVSSALGRRCWVRANAQLPLCYPNLLTLLAGDPGIGKDVAINKIGDIIQLAIQKAAPNIVARIGGESISPKGLLDRLGDQASKQTFSYIEGREKKTCDFHSLTFCVGELGTAMPEYDPKLVPIINDLYNNKRSYEDTIRGMEVKIVNPHITMLLGNQPNTLADVFPERAFRMGLTARIIFIFENSPIIRDLFVDEAEETSWDSTLEDKLAEDYVQIAKLAGPFKVTKAAKELINDFNRNRPSPVPTNRFRDYNVRRPLHAQKVAMCVSAAEGDSMVITPEHWMTALDYLFAAEARMPDIFEDVVTSRGFSETYEELKQYAGSPIKYHTLITKLSRSHPAYEVKQILQLAQEDGTLVPVMDETGAAPKKPLEFVVRDFQKR